MNQGSARWRRVKIFSPLVCSSQMPSAPRISWIDISLFTTIFPSFSSFSLREALVSFFTCLLCRVGAGRPLRDRPYPPLANRACTFPRTRLSPSPGYSLTQFSGQHQHIPLSFSAFSQVPLAHFPPDRIGFTCVITAYPSCRYCSMQSAQAITAVRWVILSLRHHAGVTLFR